MGPVPRGVGFHLRGDTHPEINRLTIFGMEASADLLTCKAITTPEPEVSTSKREVTSYKSMFGDVDRIDRVREFVRPGVFSWWPELASSVAKGRIPTRHNHKELVGVMIHAEETGEGLLTTEKYGTDPVSDRVYSLVRERILTTSSFQASYKASDRIAHKGTDGKPVWELRNLRLKEAGPADPDFAVNPETRVVAVKGLQQVAEALSNMAGLDRNEAWTMDLLRSMSSEDKDSLASILSMLPHGEAVDSILVALQGEQAADYSEATGKALQLSEAIEEWQLGRINDRLEKISRRLSAAN